MIIDGGDSLYALGLAGTVVGSGYYGNNGPANRSMIDGARGLYLDSLGNLLFCDNANRVIRKIDTRGIITTFAGNGAQSATTIGGSPTAISFYQPSFITGDSLGNVFMSDQFTVWKYTASTNLFSAIAGQASAGNTGDGGPATSTWLANPNGLWLTTSGILFLADTGNHRVRKIDLSTTIITHFAGDATGTSGSNSDFASIPATSALLNSPNGLYVDTNGIMYIADTSNNRIRKVDTNGIITTFAGNSGSGAGGDGGLAFYATFSSPRDVRGDSLGNIYVCESSVVIRVINVNGIISTLVGNYVSESRSGYSPATMAITQVYNLFIDSSGTLYFSEGFLVKKLVTYSPPSSPGPQLYQSAMTSFTSLSGVVGPVSLASFAKPAGVYIDSTGTFYVCDATILVIRKISNVTGIVSAFIGFGGSASQTGISASISLVALNVPSYITGDTSGNLYFSDQFYIWQYQPSTGIVSVLAGKTSAGYTTDPGPVSSAQVSTPMGLSLTTSGLLYFADRFNHRIRMINLATGIISLVAGTGAASGSLGDGGQATSAVIAVPTSVYVDTNGVIFITENGNYRIRKIATNGIISTFAGTGLLGIGIDGGPATLTHLSSPLDIKGDSLGNIYIVESNIIRKISSNGIITTVVGNGNARQMNVKLLPATASIIGVNGVFVDTMGTIYYNSGAILRRTIYYSPPKSTFISRIRIISGYRSVGYRDTLPAVSGQLSNPRGIFKDTNGNLYIADIGNRRFRVVDATTGMIRTFAGTGTSSSAGSSGVPLQVSFSNPTAVVGDTFGNLYLSDNIYIWLYNVTTGIVRVICGTGINGYNGDGGEGLTTLVNTVVGLWLTTTNILYFADSVNHRMRYMDLSTTVVDTYAGDGTSGNIGDGGPALLARLNRPNFFYLDSNGIMYIADRNNHKVRKIESNGIISTFAGLGIAGYGGDDGPATLAYLNLPNDVKGDKFGNIYIADGSNNIIRMVSNGIISVFLGNTFSGAPINGVVQYPYTFIQAPQCIWIDSKGSLFISGTTSVYQVEVNSTSTFQPSGQPSSQPSLQPSGQPSRQPTSQPSCQPSSQPSRQPSSQPSSQPSTRPSRQPSAQPTWHPSVQPSSQPSVQPSCQPSAQPLSWPSSQPSSQPSRQPSSEPSRQPTCLPSCQPSSQPSSQPSFQPSCQPSSLPSQQPTSHPSSMPSRQPFSIPSSQPTCRPSCQPSSYPSGQPSSSPTGKPSSQPSTQPSRLPTSNPTGQPSLLPTVPPSSQPTKIPSSRPTLVPSISPTTEPTVIPSSFPSSDPSIFPSGVPSVCPISLPTSMPSSTPSYQPLSVPSTPPSCTPSAFPSFQPTTIPSVFPSSQPSIFPSTIPSGRPSTKPSLSPSGQPTDGPTTHPSHSTNEPTCSPITSPSDQLSSVPTTPIRVPSIYPSSFPSSLPTGALTGGLLPSIKPSCGSSFTPSITSLTRPSVLPSSHPTGAFSPAYTVPPTTFHSTPLPSNNNQSTNLPSKITPVPSLMTTESPVYTSNDTESSPPILIPSRLPSVIPTEIGNVWNATSLYPSCRPSNSSSTIQPSHNPNLFSFIPSTTPTIMNKNISSRIPTLALTSSKIPTMLPSFPPSVLPSNKIPTITSLPSKTPTKPPTPSPSIRPSSSPVMPTSSISIEGNGGRALQGLLFLLGRRSSANAIVRSKLRVASPLADQHNYLLFGQKNGEKFPADIQLGSTNTIGFSIEISASLYQDTNSRSSTMIGDINGDGLVDFAIGYPLEDRCEVFYGTSSGWKNNVQLSFDVIGVSGSEFGWAIEGLGDINRDGWYDFVIAAKRIGILYVIYGKPFQKEYLDLQTDISSNDGFRIIGSSSEYANVGIGLSNGIDFNGDGLLDILFTSITNDGQGILHILFGSANEIYARDIYLINSTSFALNIQFPALAFTGLSLSGLGDFNSDGFDDVAVSSLPYQGGYQNQQTFLFYGSNSTRRGTIGLSDLFVGEDYVVITGGGFMVRGVGDVNGDTIPDLLIVNYPPVGWQNDKNNAYLLSWPRNITSSPPTIAPTRRPTSQPTSQPSSCPSYSQYPSSRPSFQHPTLTARPSGTSKPIGSRRPSISPSTSKPSTSPTRRPSIRLTVRPTLRKLPTLSPTTAMPSTRTPTRLPTYLLTHRPSMVPTMFPSNLTWEVVSCDQSDGNGTCQYPQDDGNYLIRIQPTSPDTTKGQQNVYRVTDGDGATRTHRGHRIYQIFPAKNVNVVLESFEVSSDLIDLSHFSFLSSLEDISFSSFPLTLILSKDQLVILPEFETMDQLSASSFVFSSDHSSSPSSLSSPFVNIAASDVGLVSAIALVLLVCFIGVSRELGQNADEKKEDNEKRSKGKVRKNKLMNFEDVQSSSSNSSYSSGRSHSSPRTPIRLPLPDHMNERSIDPTNLMERHPVAGPYDRPSSNSITSGYLINSDDLERNQSPCRSSSTSSSPSESSSLLSSQESFQSFDSNSFVSFAASAVNYSSSSAASSSVASSSGDYEAYSDAAV